MTSEQQIRPPQTPPPDAWEREANEPRTVTIQQVADWLHNGYGQGQKGSHLSIHSCACMHVARSLFGLNGIEYLYWPDGAGGNTWRKR